MQSGDVVADRFLIERLAGSGGMGEVYRARDRTTGDVVALKTLRKPNEHSIERFVRESETLAKLSHPGIVRHVAHGRTADGGLFLAMEWLEGLTLSERLAKDGLTLEETLALLKNLSQALAAAHEIGIVHRDIKPNNTFLIDGSIDHVKLLDFGIARARDTLRELTQTGAMLGTPGYMAPEQARGEREVDARADVFALGCILFKCLTGRAAFVGDDVLSVLLKVVLESAPRVSELRDDVPEALDDLVARMLSKEPADRPPNARAVIAELNALGNLTGRRMQRWPTTQNAITTSERRLMCVLLAGLGPSARASEDEETAPAREAAYRDNQLRQTLQVHGGQLDYLADGTLFVNVIGTGAATDHAARAARCGLAVRDALPDAPIVVAAGGGMLTGRVPVGEVIDRAVKLLAITRPSEIRLDQVVAGLLDVRFDVHGDATGLLLRNERDITEARRTLLGKPTACVGRERELLTLEAIWTECIAEPVARAALVTATPGVGKSRLRYEFLAKLQHRGELQEIWVGRGDPMSAGSPFGMIAPPIRRAAGLRSGEPLATRQQKLEARIGRYVSGGELRRISEFIGEMVGVPYPEDGSLQLRAARRDPVLLGDQMRRAWEDWLRAECGQQPVLIVLDDLQWGDVPSVKFIGSVLRSLSDKPLMVLALARPEIHEVFPKIWSERDVQEIRLSPLTKKGSEKLVRQVLGDEVSETVVARLTEMSAGNAFYLEELIRSVAEGRGDELPATVLAMVQARLEALESEMRRMLRAASIFGEVFWQGGVLTLLGGEDVPATKQLREWLAELVRRELIATRNDARFPNEDEYVFRSALVREGAYAMLTEGDRLLGHRLAASWLESKGEDDAVVLAEHFERGGEPLRAVAWYARASQQALGANDFAAARAHADRGLACGATGEALGALRLVQAEAHNWSGEHHQALDAATDAMKHLERGSADWCTAAGEVAVASGRLEKADSLETLADELLAGQPGDAPAGPRAIASVRAAMPLLLAGRSEVADRLLARLEEVEGSEVGDPTVLARLAEARGTRALLLGDPSAYIAHCGAAARCFEQAGDLRGACLQRVNAGCVSMEIGAYAEAEAALRDALAAADRMGLSTVSAAARNNLGLALARQGALEEARAVERGAIAASVSQGFRRLEAGSRMYLATILMLSNDLPNAEREACTAVEMTAGAAPMRAQALSTLAQVRLAAGKPREALEAAREAMDAFEVSGGVEEGESLLRLVHAEALHATGDVAAARAAISAAFARLEQRASKISDDGRRRTFLEGVADNVRTRTLVQLWGV